MSASTSVPMYVPPMLAVYGEPFDSESHWFEPKWDGLRCLLYSSAGTVRLHSRNGRDITASFPELAGRPILEADHYLLDGELICLGPEGRPTFDRVRDRMLLGHAGRIAQAAYEHPAVYVAFDILYCDGAPLLDLPLEERRAILEGRFLKGREATLSPVTPGEGKALFNAVAKQRMEGIVAKERQSPYVPGRRSRAWIKVRHTRLGTFWVVGYTSDGHSDLRSLAVAERGAGGGMIYAGHVGSGLNQRIRTKLLRLLTQLPRPEPDAYEVPEGERRRTVWIQPFLQVRVEYLERGANGHLRHPVFKEIAVDNEVHLRREER